MSAQGNKAIVQTMIEAINRGNLEGSVAYTHQDCTLNGQPFGQEGDRSRMQMYLTAFPDQVWTLDRLIAEGEWVSIAYTFTGTFTVALGETPPTGKQVIFTGVSHYHMQDGQFIEVWEYIDRLNLYQGLGLIPVMA